MPRSIIRTITTAIAIAALAAPTALARPADTPTPVAQAAAKAEQEQDLRHLRAGGHVIDAATKHEQDGRPIDAVDSATREPTGPPTWPVNPKPITSATRLPVGPPTWPVNPKPITSVPAAKGTDGGNGVDWTMIGLGIVGLLAVAGIVGRTRHIARARIAA